MPTADKARADRVLWGAGHAGCGCTASHYELAAQNGIRDFHCGAALQWQCANGRKRAPELASPDLVSALSGFSGPMYGRIEGGLMDLRLGVGRSAAGPGTPWWRNEHSC